MTDLSQKGGHTELPWSVFCPTCPTGERPGIEGNGHSVVMFGCSDDDAGIQGATDAEISANAEFIVKACNSHYALIEALEAAKVFAEAELEIRQACMTEDADDGYVSAARSVIARIDAALAKVRGQS